MVHPGVSVNTIVTIVERCDNPAERDSHLVKFVKVKKPLAELIPGYLVSNALTPGHAPYLIANIERAGTCKYARLTP